MLLLISVIRPQPVKQDGTLGLQSVRLSVNL